MKREIKIIVVGETGTGKTTISRLIYDALKDWELDVSVCDTPDHQTQEEFLHATWNYLDRRAESLVKSETHIMIETAQILRRGKK